MDHVGRLREIHESGERIDPSTYVDLVRLALRSAPSNTRELLQATYQKALQETYASRTPGSLAKVAQLGATQLNAVGEHAGGLARLEQALQMADDDPASRAVLSLEIVVYKALSEDPRSALPIPDMAALTQSTEFGVETAIGLETNSAILAMVLLQPGASEAAAAAIAAARSNEFDWMASAGMVFLISTLVATDDVNQAGAWADALHGYASALNHEARELDATVAQLALRGRRRLIDVTPELDATGQKTLNGIALWRLQVLRLYHQTLRAESVAADESVSQLARTRGDVNGGFGIASDGFGAFVDAHLGSGSVSRLPVPGTPTLLMLSGALAGGEAAAVGGSQSLAADWLRWFEGELPSEISSSLEWPSCRRRVEGLLLLRLGREREAVTRLQDAIRCCDDRGDQIQAAIGRVQLAEALLRGTTASMLPADRARSLRQEGADELRELGIDPIPFAYAASRTFLSEEQMPERGGLTPREAQVLGRLAQGLSYREIGVDLGINSRTVGVHASHCYEKLGVRNRVEAVKLAQELGIV